MTPGWRTIFYLIAVILFLGGFFGFKPGTQRVRLDSLGLAFFAFPLLWDAWSQV